MSHAVERMRTGKTLTGLPPQDDKQARVRYVWNRIVAEATLAVADYEATNGFGFTSKVPDGHQTTGRRSSASVLRMMNTHFLCGSCTLLRSVATRLASLVAHRTTDSSKADLEFDELVSYFTFYNDWSLGDAASDGNDPLDGDRRHDGDGECPAQTARGLSPSSISSLAPTTACAAGAVAQRERFLKSLAFSLEHCIAEDLIAVYDRDPAVLRFLEPLLYFKGFHALQLHRLAERVWYAGEIDFALLLQSVSSRVFGVDIHPAAHIGIRVMFDHGSGIVVGETVSIGNDVSMLHGVTLGGTGKTALRDRHPKVGDGVLIGAGAIVLGNIPVGDNARVAAGAVVVKPVAAGSTVVGVAAKELPPKLPRIDSKPERICNSSFSVPPSPAPVASQPCFAQPAGDVAGAAQLALASVVTSAGGVVLGGDGGSSNNVSRGSFGNGNGSQSRSESAQQKQDGVEPQTTTTADAVAAVPLAAELTEAPGVSMQFEEFVYEI